MKMRSGPKVSGRSRRVAADQGWSLRGVPLYTQAYHHIESINLVHLPPQKLFCWVGHPLAGASIDIMK